MFYWSEAMGLEARRDAGEIPNVVAAFEHLARQECVDPERVGFPWDGFWTQNSAELISFSASDRSHGRWHRMSHGDPAFSFHQMLGGHAR